MAVVHKLAGAVTCDQKTKRIIRRFPELLEVKSDSGATPLHDAIFRSNTEFVAAATENVEDLDRVLRIRDDKGWTCVHTAITYRLLPKARREAH